MKKLTTYAYALTTLLLISCGGSDEVNSGSGSQNATPETPIVGKFKKNALIEDFTGTWCGYCPRVAYGIQKVEEQNLAAFPVAIHRGPNGADPYNFEATALENTIGLTGYPTAKINRKTTWINESNPNEVKNSIKLNADLGIALNSTVSGGNINLDVNMKFDANLTDLKLVVYVVEDGLVHNQNNYTSYYGGGSTIQNMVHNHVLRSCLTDLVNGDPISGTDDGATITKNYNIAVPSNVANAANISFVAFVIDASGKVLNVRGAAPNVNQTFEENL